MTTPLDHADPASVYDCALRFTMPSRTRPGVTQLVELDSYGCNGECSCEDFSIRFRKILAQGITPAEALARGLVTLKRKKRPDKHPDDALRCDHIVDAYRQFAVMACRSLSHAKTHSPAPTQNSAHPDDTDPPPF